MHFKITYTIICIYYQEPNVSHIYVSNSRCEMKWLGRVPDIVFQWLWVLLFYANIKEYQISGTVSINENISKRK